jgi:hypothetical protein
MCNAFGKYEEQGHMSLRHVCRDAKMSHQRITQLPYQPGAFGPGS